MRRQGGKRKKKPNQAGARWHCEPVVHRSVVRAATSSRALPPQPALAPSPPVVGPGLCQGCRNRPTPTLQLYNQAREVGWTLSNIMEFMEATGLALPALHCPHRQLLCVMLFLRDAVEAGVTRDYPWRLPPDELPAGIHLRPVLPDLQSRAT